MAGRQYPEEFFGLNPKIVPQSNMSNFLCLPEWNDFSHGLPEK
jgi:hypothetical protein